MMRRGWTVLVGGVLVALLSWGMTELPVPYVALGPGPTVDTLSEYEGEEVIRISGRETSESAGHLNLTTVSVRQELDLGTALRFWVDGTVSVVPRELVYPPGQTDEQVDRQNEEAFLQSQTSAETAALRELGYPVVVVVTGIGEGSPSAGLLAADDVLTSVDGEEVTSRGRLVELIRSASPGDEVRVGYERAGAVGESVITAGVGDDGQTVIGVEIDQRQPHPFEIEIDVEDIGGPSAGLMFALGIMDKVDPEDLTGGLFVAGTGEIDDDGRVGPIGGIPQKMVAAERVGASVFLAPAANCAEALRTVPDGLRLVRVDTLDDALSSLEALRSGSGDVPAC